MKWTQYIPNSICMENTGNITLGKIPVKGGSYQGEWRSCKRHGHGKMVYPDKRVYEGDWMGDKRHGFGTLTYNTSKHGSIKQYAGIYM